jgi:hypothetical protein
MSEWPKTAHGRFQAVALAIFLHLWASNAQGAEQRCTELGSNCVCSEPLNTTAFPGGPPHWNPADSTTKECSAEGVPGAAIARNAQDVQGSADGAALKALPSGHGVSHFLRGRDGHEGIFMVGNGGTVSSSFVRIAARWYIYRSPNFEFVHEGACENTKVTEHNYGSRVTVYSSGSNVIFSTYNYLSSYGWSPGVDCCNAGPGVNTTFPLSQHKGKWWRYEVVMSNRSGPNFDLKFYGKNVTDNGPEYTIIDLSRNSKVSNLTPPDLMSMILINNYRQGVCLGWSGISHYMLAGWTTNAGQRIGAAKEIESPGTIPSPTNLKVSDLFREQRVLASTSVPTLPLALRGATGTWTTMGRTHGLPLAPSR